MTPKMKQKNYEAIKIYNQKEKIFELKGKIQTLEKQLAIAVEALKELTNSDNWSVEQVDGEHVFCFNVKYPWRFTGEALKKIKELEK